MFDQFYHQSGDQLKLSFLDDVFIKYPNLKEDFLAFYLNHANRPLKITVIDPDDFILAAVDLIKADLESIDVSNPDWRNYVPRHNEYIPEYEAMIHMAEDAIDRIIGVHVCEVERYCTLHQYDLAFLQMISMYQACAEAELDDEYETLPDANKIMIDLLEQKLIEIIPIFHVMQLSEDQIFTVATVFFDQFQKKYQDEPEFLNFLEPYLSAMTHTGAEAAVLLDVIEDKKAAELVPWLYTETKRKAGGQQEWEQAARKVFKKSVSVASSLLEFYKNNNKSAFLQTAKELWAAGLFQVEFAKFYFDKLNPADDPDFYKAVTLCLNSERFSKKYYRVHQTLMEKEERLRYISTIKWNKPAYVSALCMEEKYTEALKFAGHHADRSNIVKIMTPCLKYQPTAALEVLEQKLEALLVEERGRDFYENVARVLKAAAEHSAIKIEAEKLAHKIYSSYSRLKAVRSELKAAGVIKV